MSRQSNLRSTKHSFWDNFSARCSVVHVKKIKIEDAASFMMRQKISNAILSQIMREMIINYKSDLF